MRLLFDHRQSQRPPDDNGQVLPRAQTETVICKPPFLHAVQFWRHGKLGHSYTYALNSPVLGIYQGSHLDLNLALSSYTPIPHHAVLHPCQPVVLDGARICSDIHDRHIYRQRPTSRICEVANMCCAYEDCGSFSLHPADTHTRPSA